MFNIDSLSPHYSVPGDRSDILRRMENRVYENEQGIYITNGLSTELICFPSDTHLLRKEVLAKKVRSAISYATTLHDIAELNTLQYLPPPAVDGYAKLPDPALTLGLYLYFADEVSRRSTDDAGSHTKQNKTFLTAMRGAHAELNTGDGFIRDNLLKKSEKALKILELDKEPKRCLYEWFKAGTYTIGSDRHYIDTDGHAHGAYAKLAQAIISSGKDRAEGLNLAISYALGNRNNLTGKTAAEMLAATQNVTDAGIRECIAHGTEERIRRIKSIIEKEVSHSEATPKPPLDTMKILSFLPSAALEILYREGYTCVYANAASLENCYPKKDVPGLTHSENESNRKTGTGLRQKRYQMIFLCNGTGQYSPAFKADPSLRFEMAGQTLGHEIMHMVTGYLTEEEIKNLHDAVDAVGQELEVRKDALPAFFKQRLRTIYPYIPPDVVDNGTSFWTLADAANSKSELYNAYVMKDMDTRWEEVACNAYGLMCTEYATGKAGSAGDPFHGESEGFSSLKRLAEVIEKSTHIALERCREKHPFVRENRIA